MKYVKLLFVSLVLVGCAKVGVTQEHISNANVLCAENQGVHIINNAKYSTVLESCDFRCLRYTDNKEYSMRVACNDGTVVNKTWVK